MGQLGEENNVHSIAECAVLLTVKIQCRFGYWNILELDPNLNSRPTCTSVYKVPTYATIMKRDDKQFDLNAIQ